MMYNLSMLFYPFSNAKAYSVKVCITADVRQPWTNPHDLYFEYLIIRFDYLIIPFDYSITA